MSDTKPTGFHDLSPAELYRSALEDFALPVEEADKGKKKVLAAAFVEGGVEWADYVAQHPEVAPEPEPTPEPVATREPERDRGAVVTANPPKHNSVHDEQETGYITTGFEDPVEQPVQIVVKEQIPVASNQQYLIKMVRDNLLYETRGHRFTSTHPYALVGAADADYILTQEDGFRQATPSELQEFYG